MIMTSLEISGNHRNAMQNLTKLFLSLIQRSLNAENSKLNSMKVSYNWKKKKRFGSGKALWRLPILSQQLETLSVFGVSTSAVSF